MDAAAAAIGARHGIRLTVLVCAMAALGCATPADPEAEWPQFLGPHRDGKVAYPINHEWAADGPPVLWRKAVGAGYASPSIADGTLYLFHRVNDEEVVEALDPMTGDTRWRSTYPATYHDDLFGFDEGPRAAPTVVDGVVYTAGAARVIQALDAATGERRWGFDAIERYATRRSPFGNASQPFWVDGRILLALGGAEAGIVAVDAATGETVWTATDHEASYAPPLLTEIGGLQRMLFFTRVGLVDLDPADGRVRSVFDWRARSFASVNAAMPVRIGDRIFLSASYRTGATLLEVTDDGFESVWASDDVLSNHYVSSIYHDGTLFGMHGRQPLNPSLRAIDPEIGEILWTEGRRGTASLLLAGDTLIVMREDGELSLVAAVPEEYRELNTAHILDGEVRAYPSLAAGILYVRNATEMIAVDLRLAARGR